MIQDEDDESKDIVGVKLGLKGISINELLRLSDKNIIDETSLADNEYKSTINYNSLHKESSDILRRPDTIRGYVHFRKNGDSNISYNVRHNVKYSQQSNIRNGSGDVYFSHSVEL